MRVFKTECLMLVVVLLFGITMPAAASEDFSKAIEKKSGSESSDTDDTADEPVMVGGSYARQPFYFDSRSLDEVLPPVPTEILDPPFDRYVDLQMLRRAWEELDPAMLADAALQLAEGERVLLRSHKAFKAEDVLSLAITAAAESRDTGTLERLTKAVARSDNADLKAQIDAVAKLASEPRTIDPAMMLSVEETSVEEFATIRDLLRALRAARIVGNRRALDEIQEALEGGLELPEMPRDYLLKMTTEARSALPEEEEPSATLEALEKLSGGSRDDEKEKQPYGGGKRDGGGRRG